MYQIIFSPTFLDIHKNVPCFHSIPPDTLPEYFLLDCEIFPSNNIEEIESMLTSRGVHFTLVADDRFNTRHIYYTWTDKYKRYCTYRRLWLCSTHEIDYNILARHPMPHDTTKTKGITYTLRDGLAKALAKSPSRLSIYLYPHEHSHVMKTLEMANYKIYGCFNTHSNINYVNILAVRQDVEDDITFVLQGNSNGHITDINRNICFQYGIPIDASWNEGDLRLVKRAVRKYNYNNAQNLHLQCFSSISGISRSNTEYVVKVRSDEYYTDWDLFIKTMRDNRDKIITNNVFARKCVKFAYHPSDHVMGGLKANMLGMFEETILNTKTRRFIENVAEQNLAFGFLLYKGHIPKYEVSYKRDDVYKLMSENFVMIPIERMGECNISAFGSSYVFNDTGEKSNDSKYKFYIDVESIDDMFT